jgi:LPS export ABC transporter protein LptC
MNIKYIFLTFFCILLSFSSVRSQEGELPASDSTDQQLQGFNLNGYTSNGEKSWEVNGEKADITDEQIKVTNVDANFFGKEKANLTSKSGTIDKVNGQVRLQEDVVITSERGATMTTDSLDWNRNQDIVSTLDKVRIEDGQSVVTGQGLTAHPNLKKASINKDVKAVINTDNKKYGKMSDSQKITITSDGPMKLNQAQFHASFTDNVVAIEEATGRELHADQMDVWFDEKNKKIRKMICKGNVKAVQGESASYAEEMIYTGEDELLVMKGRPKIVFDTLEGKGSGIFQKLGK